MPSCYRKQFFEVSGGATRCKQFGLDSEETVRDLVMMCEWETSIEG